MIRIVETDEVVVELAATTANGDIRVITEMTGGRLRMIKVNVTGWSHGLNKVHLNHLLRQHTGCGLAEAKRAVDQLLAGEVLTYQFPDPESASAFYRSASAVGANCIAEEHGTGSDPARLEGDILKCGTTVGKPG